MKPTPEFERMGMIQAAELSNVVRVSVPVEAYFSLDKIQKIHKDILGRLGCMACCSGWDIRFDLERRFMVDERLNVKSVGFLPEGG
jgi:hypothetical protein